MKHFSTFFIHVHPSLPQAERKIHFFPLSFEIFFPPSALKYRSQCWTSRGVFFIVNQYRSIGCLGVEYGSISRQAVEEIWFQLAREAHSRFPSSGNSRHGNISQMDWYRLARTFLATEPAQGNFCHISLTQLGQPVKKKKKDGNRVPEWPSVNHGGKLLNKYLIIITDVACSTNRKKLLNFRGKHSPNNSDLKIDTDVLLSITEPQHGHVVCNFWHSLSRGQREICTVSCYSFTEQMFWRKLANGEIFSFHLSDGSIVIKPAHLSNLNAAGESCIIF